MTNSERYLEESQAGEVFVRPAKPSAMFNCFAAERLADGGRISCLAGGGGEHIFRTTRAPRCDHQGFGPVDTDRG